MDGIAESCLLHERKATIVYLPSQQHFTQLEEILTNPVDLSESMGAFCMEEISLSMFRNLEKLSGPDGEQIMNVIRVDGGVCQVCKKEREATGKIFSFCPHISFDTSKRPKAALITCNRTGTHNLTSWMQRIKTGVKEASPDILPRYHLTVTGEPPATQKNYDASKKVGFTMFVFEVHVPNTVAEGSVVKLYLLDGVGERVYDNLLVIEGEMESKKGRGRRPNHYLRDPVNELRVSVNDRKAVFEFAISRVSSEYNFHYTVVVDAGHPDVALWRSKPLVVNTYRNNPRFKHPVNPSKRASSMESERKKRVKAEKVKKEPVHKQLPLTPSPPSDDLPEIAEIDGTKLSDNEIIEILRTIKAKQCGEVYDEQYSLHTPEPEPETAKRPVKRPRVAAARRAHAANPRRVAVGASEAVAAMTLASFC